jgi:hypothetical protein
MRGQNKTKGQLINELNKPRHRIIEEGQLEGTRKRTEEALRKSENYYRTLVQNLPQKIFLKDKNSVFLSCNENFSGDLKMRPTEITGKTDYDFYPKELAEKYRADDKRIMESGRTEDIEEKYIQNGMEVIVHTVKTPIKDEKGKIIGILGIFWDITERKHADDELKKYRQHLEELVEERTAELRNANERLQQEITERQRAEKALRKSEERYRTIFEESRDAIYITSQTGEILDANQSMLDLFGYTREEMIGFNARQTYLHSDDRLKFQRAIEREGFVREYEIKLRKKDGAEMECLLTAIVRKTADGNIAGYQGIIRDITERKRMEEALKESEVRYRLLAENASDTIWTVNMNMQLTYISPSVTRLLGYTVEEAKSRTMEEVFTQASFETAMRAFAEEMALENARQGDPNRPRILELESTRKDGGGVRVEANFSFLRDAMGKPVGILSIARDITERKRMEEALRQSEEKYRSILEEMEEGYFETDLVCNLTFINDAGCRHLGYSRQELIGMTNRVYADEENAKKVFQAFNKAYKTGEPCRVFDYEITRKDGTNAIIELSASLIRDPEGKPTGFRGVSRNITEHKRIEEERERLIHELQDALVNVKTLRGLLPICSHCKKIRDDKGYWNQIESYIRDHSGAEFSHGMCPECMKKLYPDYVD